MLWLVNDAERKLPLWRVALGSLIIVCLAVTLANRFRHIANVGQVDVRSCTPKVKVQHRDIGAQCWSAPVALFCFLQSPGTTQSSFLEAQTPPFLHVEGSRYNRPPPIS
jgi:hypothetical protein